MIHIYRHPRDQWCSSLLDPKCFPATAPTSSFEPYDNFYLLMWARDLKYHFPFLNEWEAPHPYLLFYYIWKLSYLFGIQFADHSLAFETLIAEPEGELRALFKAVGIDHYDVARLKDLVVPQTLGKWTQYASDDWFGEQEAVCEAVLASYLRSTQPAQVVGQKGR